MVKKKKTKDKGVFSYWKHEWADELKKHYKLIVFSIFLVLLAGVINYNAGLYVTEFGGSAALSDIVLDNFGPFDLSFSFVYIWLFLVGLLIIYPLVFRVKMFHRVLAQFSVLIIVRSFFIILTHLKNPVDAIYATFPGSVTALVFQNDLFFSGHTAFPFLGFLIYRESKIRWVFLAGSILMAITVLGMHQHYTIDVLAAWFITYGTYKVARFFSPFKR